MSRPEPNPSLEDVLEALKKEIFATINCIQIGKVEAYNKEEQTVSAQIVVKRRIGNDKIISYPLLVDCPVFFLQGGGAYFDLPIKPGDFCIILFNDRDIDDWFTSGSEKEPRTKRKHSLSDGIAMVGLNPKTKVLNHDGSNLDIWGPTGNDRIRITPSGKMELGENGKDAARKDDSVEVEIPAGTVIVSVSGGSGAPAVGVLNVAPIKVQGKITGGSTEVTIK